MRRRIILTSVIVLLILAIGQADKGHFLLSAAFAAWPAFVLISNLIFSVREYGW